VITSREINRQDIKWRGKMKNTHNIFVGKLEGKRAHGKRGKKRAG
jgi:hypothetical protein